jgi:hypothetical protein
MLGTRHPRKFQKLPIFILVLLLCVQSLGFAGHGLMISMQNEAQSATVAEQDAPPCHDMPEMAAAQTQDQTTSNIQMPCCDDGQCADAHCMMPAGTHFSLVTNDYFIEHTGNAFVVNTRSLDAIKPSPPIRPPIA